MFRRDKKAKSWNPASRYDSFLTTPLTQRAKSGPRSCRKLPSLHRVVSSRDTAPHPRLALQAKVEEVRAAEFPLQLGVCVAVSEDLSSIPNTHTMAQLPRTPIPGDLTPSSDLHRHWAYV